MNKSIFHRSGTLAVSAFVMTLAATPVAFGQQNSDQLEGRARDVNQTVGSLNESRDNQAADSAQMGDMAPVTFADLLKDPDNVDNNLAYAKQQVDAGRPDLAVPAVERVLLKNPDLHDVRALYAILLYRLDRLDEARAEFKLVQQSGAAKDLKDMAGDYIDRIDYQQKTFRYGISIGLGIHHEDNPTAVPTNRRARFNDVLFNTGLREKDDQGVIGFVSVDFEKKWADQNWDGLRGEISYYVDDMQQTDVLDVDAVFGELSATWRGEGNIITPRISMGQVSLNDQTYVKTVSGDITLERDFALTHHHHDDPFRFRGWLTVGMIDNGYGILNPSSSLPGGAPTTFNQDGITSYAELGGRHDLSHDATLEATYRFSDKGAIADFESYRSHLLEASALHLWKYDTYGRLTGSIERRDYEERIPGVSISERDDLSWRARVEVGATMNSIISYLGDPDQSRNSAFGPGWRNMSLSLSAERYEQDSNIEQFDYKNTKVQFLIVRRFDY